MWSDGGVQQAELTQLRDVAVGVAREAADLVITTRRTATMEVDTKTTETDVVTAADRAAERLIRQRLGRLRPGEQVLGEEGGGEAGPGELCWVVDPIDGTVNYLYGYPWYAVSVAAQLDGESLAGAVVEPVSGRTWTATRGGGAQCDGQPLHASAADRLELSLLATGFAYLPARRARQAALIADMITRVRDVRRSGAASLDLCAVAAGWVDAYVETGLHRWDWAAGALVASEAGAVVRLPGEDRQLGEELIFAAAPGIATPLRASLLDAGVAGI